MVTISVVIPIYNTDEYLNDCIESVLNQSVAFDEIILINDGSTDNSLDICQYYKSKFSNIKLVSQRNKGAGATRNVGINNTNSSFLMFLDSDDYIEPNTVEIVKKEMNGNRLDILYFDSNIFNELDVYKKNPYDRVGRIEERIRSGKEYFVRNYTFTYVVQPCMAAFNVEFLKENDIKFPEVSLYEDVYFTLKSLLMADRVKYIPQKLYNRRYRLNSIMTKRWTVKEMDDIFLVFKKSWDLLVKTINVSDDLLDTFKIYLIHSYLNIRKDVDRVFREDGGKSIYMKDVDIEFLKYWNKIKKSESDIESNVYVTAAIYRLVNKVEKNSLLNKVFAKKYNYKKIYEDSLRKCLKTLYLENKDFNVGIYGTGDHTEKLIYWHEKLIGEIKCDLYFIDTYKKSFEENYKNVPIINIRDAGQYVDVIIISSIYYENIMLNITKEIYGDKIPVISFYEKRNYDFLVEVK